MWAIHMGPKWVINVKTIYGLSMGNIYVTPLSVMFRLDMGELG